MKIASTFILSLILVLTFGNKSVFACSAPTYSFCETVNFFNVEPLNVISGLIIASDSDGISLEVISVLRGSETRDTIRVWDGEDFDCNGLVSMAASELGEIDDTIIVILDNIDSVIQPWDVIGDYTPIVPLEATRSLEVRNGIVYGLIKRLGTWPPDQFLMQASYSNVINSWETSMSCSLITSFENQIKSKVSLGNPIADYLSINLHQLNEIVTEISIYDISGRRLTTLNNPATEVRINFTMYESGTYLIRFRNSKNETYTEKVVKP